MSEEYLMQNQKELGIDIVTSYNDVPYFLIDEDLEIMGRQDYVDEVAEIKAYYKVYEKGSEFIAESNGDYVPSSLRYKKAASILNKEARFFVSNTPTFNVNIDDVSKKSKEDNTIIQKYLDKVLEDNGFGAQVIKGAKDCFIGKRIAIILNFNEETGISLLFLNSLEFIHQFSKENPNELQRFVCFHCLNSTNNKVEQVWFKKIYELINGKVYVSESYYDGVGQIIDDENYPIIENMETSFTSIPAVVILNDGLTGDIKGQSELKDLLDDEAYYNKLANADMDAERKSMNPIAYAIDASEGSTKNLSNGPGAFWDIQTDVDKPEEAISQAKVGLIEPNMSYSGALKITLDRVENNMYSSLDVPNITSEQLSGVITSGKTIGALYWGLTVRCDEKMLAWRPALRYIAEKIIEGGRLYPNTTKKYTANAIPLIECDILVENNYPLPEDEQEEKSMDISEVDAKLMSKKAYIKKWRNLNDEDAEEELLQIKKEQDMFDDSYVPFDYKEGSNLTQDDNKDQSNINYNDDEKDASDDKPVNQEGIEKV